MLDLDVDAIKKGRFTGNGLFNKTIKNYLTKA